MSVTLIVTGGKSPFSSGFTEKLAALLQGLLLEQGLGEGEVGLILTGDSKMQDLNRQYRDIDAPTDVLSFSYLEPGDKDQFKAGDLSVGDIYISLEKAEQQAGQAGHSLERETALLAVHGMLHLLGYDHDSAQAEKLMWSKQEELLKEIE